jgi:hypothetical protein
VSRWRHDDSDDGFGRSFDGSSDGDRAFDAERSQASTRAQRLLVRVLLVLRGEVRRSSDPARDARRAEILADRILADFPRRVLPIGLAALAIVVLACSLPLLRDALPTAHLGAHATPVATALESGLRSRGEAMSDGIDALRTVIRPFAGSEPVPSGLADPAADPAADPYGSSTPPGSDEATAPFTKS